jgi:hypothetical protein
MAEAVSQIENYDSFQYPSPRSVLVVDGFNMVDTIAESAPDYNARLVNSEWTEDEPVIAGGWE